ncbi:hypothetical protein LTS15_002743 [Exophiala xenobiotica]|nr:hypothetical protein LTS15_002743 [Exophiala xenobiotica]
MALTYSIESALWHASKSLEFHFNRKRWGCSLYLHNQMLGKGWCPNDLRRLHEHGSISLMYYASTLERKSPPGISHRLCNDGGCQANYVRPETYETKHREDCSGCNHIKPLINHAEEILRGSGHDGFPVLEVTPYGDSFNLEYVEFAGNLSFCAISHVWSDGLGNNETNSLPTCQVRRLYTVAQEILRRGQGGSGKSCLIWIDTLCVPRRQPFRKFAISRIATSFAKAKAVLVLDSELQQISSKTAISEVLTRISCCGWMRRVWTLREGSLAAPALNVQLADRAIALDSVVKQQRKDWQKRKLVTDSLASDTGIAYENLTVTRLAYRKLSTSSMKSHAFGFALHSFAGRSTSWQGDEYLCLGILLGLKPKSIEELYETPVDKRSEYLFSVLHKVPHGILFCPGAKLSTPD